MIYTYTLQKKMKGRIMDEYQSHMIYDNHIPFYRVYGKIDPNPNTKVKNILVMQNLSLRFINYTIK